MGDDSQNPQFVAGAYDRARKPYTKEVITVCNSVMPSGNPAIVLDLGCGTGISTRQLSAEKRLMIGCDSDLDLIDYALKHNSRNVSFRSARAEQLPFDSDLFHAVTTFGAFHWFANEQAVKEIWRVLKPEGTFIIVNKHDTGSFTQDVREILNPLIAIPVERAKSKYDPERLIQGMGFSGVVTQHFEDTETFSIEEMVSLIKSMNIWTRVPSEQRVNAEQMLESCFRSQLKNKLFSRPIVTTLICSSKMAEGI